MQCVQFLKGLVRQFDLENFSSANDASRLGMLAHCTVVEVLHVGWRFECCPFTGIPEIRSILLGTKERPSCSCFARLQHVLQVSPWTTTCGMPQKRKTFFVQEKYEILMELESGMSEQEVLAAHDGLHPSTLRGFKKKKDVIIRQQKG